MTRPRPLASIPAITSTTALRAALYGRASNDPKKRGRSIRDQFAVGEIECEDRGWSIADYYEDRDLSASRSARKTRKDFERMVADAEAGVFDVIVYAERSRMSRLMDTSMKIRRLCEDTGVLLFYGGRVYNMRISADRVQFTRDAQQSEEEAEVMIERALRTARLNARRGAPHGRAGFGFTRRYDPDDGHLIGQVAHPEHAPVVVELFRRADARENVSVLRELIRPYIPDITRLGVRYMLTNKAYIGIRVNYEDETPATWDGLVDPLVFARVQVILKDPERKTMTDNRVKHLFSGIAKCSRCIALELTADRAPFMFAKHRKSDNWSGYNCDLNHGRISEPLLTAFVVESLFRWLASPKFRQAFQRSPSDDGQLQGQRDLLAALLAQMEDARQMAGVLNPLTGRPRLSMASLAAMEDSLLPQIMDAEQQVASLSAVGDHVLSQFTADPDAVEATWEAMTLVQQRYVLRRCVSIVVNGARVRGIRHIEPGRITLTFAGEPGFSPLPNRRLI